MGYQMYTKNGHNFFEMAALLQNAIRRQEFRLAGYAANEMFPKYRGYLWRRLLIISAEDCYGIVTKEIIALKQAEEAMKKPEEESIFISKAITLLCYAKKNRDADYFACNLMQSDTPIPPHEVPCVPIEEGILENGEIPDWAFNWHTSKGRYRGKDVIDAIVGNQFNMRPVQIGLWDDQDWGYDIDKCLAKHNPKGRKPGGIDWEQEKINYAQGNTNTISNLS